MQKLSLEMGTNIMLPAADPNQTKKSQVELKSISALWKYPIHVVIVMFLFHIASNLAKHSRARNIKIVLCLTLIFKAIVWSERKIRRLRRIYFEWMYDKLCWGHTSTDASFFNQGIYKIILVTFKVGYTLSGRSTRKDWFSLFCIMI